MKVSQVRAANPDIRVLGGLGGMMFLEELRHGAHGTMTGFGYPEILVDIYTRYTAGDIDGATGVFYKYLPLIRFENQPRINLAHPQAHLSPPRRHRDAARPGPVCASRCGDAGRPRRHSPEIGPSLMNLGLKGRRALVLAASRGLGYACARGLAQEGCDLVICSRDEARIQAAAEQIRKDTGVARRSAGRRRQQRRAKPSAWSARRSPPTAGWRSSCTTPAARRPARSRRSPSRSGRRRSSRTS